MMKKYLFLIVQVVIMEDELLNIILCKTMEDYTIANYINDCKQGNKNRMAEFIRKRFCERYIEPFKAIRDKKKKMVLV